MNAIIIEPMDIISKLKIKFIKRSKGFIHGEFSFENFISCFRNSIIIRTVFMTERTSDTKGTDKFINNFVLEFTSSVGMENAYFGKINAAIGAHEKKVCKKSDNCGRIEVI